MKTFPLFALLLLLLASFSSCEKKITPAEASLGTFKVKFENVMGPQDNQGSFGLKEVGNTDYPYTNAAGQSYNVTFLRYYISEVVLEGPDGAVYAEPLRVSPMETNGYHLIDAATPASQSFTLQDVPAGAYNKISFLLGVDSTGVLEGAAGGTLDPATSGMFWNWNAGYVALKIEGQSPVSPGNASGNTITPENENGIVFHLGGWKNIEGTPFVYNNQRISLDFDTNARVGEGLAPSAHLELDVAALFDGAATGVDFSRGNVNVHRPADGAGMARNAAAAFRYDHVHQ